MVLPERFLSNGVVQYLFRIVRAGNLRFQDRTQLQLISTRYDYDFPGDTTTVTGKQFTHRQWPHIAFKRPLPKPTESP